MSSVTALSEVEKRELIRLLRRREVKVAPLSFAQLRFWLSDQLAPGHPGYNLTWLVRLRGALDLRAVEASFRAITARHEILRARYLSLDGTPMQIVVPEPKLTFRLVDRTATPEIDHEEEVRRIAREQALESFDIARGPLLRTVCVRVAADGWVLVMCAHHIAIDAWSSRLLVEEFGKFYAGIAAGQAPRLPPLPLTYSQLAAREQTSFPAARERLLAYWKTKLAGELVAIDFPLGKPATAETSSAAEGESIRVPPELADGLAALCRREKTTLFVLLLAAFKTVLYRSSGTNDVVLCIPIANRDSAESRGIIGCFINTLLHRTVLEGHMSFRELLADVRQTTLEAYAHKDMPFDTLIQEINPRRERGRPVVFQALFNHLAGLPRPDFRVPGIELVSYGLAEPAATQLDLTLTVVSRGSELSGMLEYSSELFERSTIRRMVEHMVTVLGAVVRDPEQRLDELPLLSGAERAQLLEWRGWRQEWKEETVAGLVEAQAERTPEAVAVTFGGTSLSYAELERRSNRLGHALRRRGVGRDVLVGVYVERSVEMVVALLGVLKAGGAYVPLDPDAPEERLSFMLSDAAPAVVVTDRGHAAGLGEHGAEVLLVDDASLAGEAVTRPDATLAGRDLAYVIYTSGSTGRPKGVMVEHRGVVNLLLAMRDRLELGPEDRLVAVTTMAFDIAALELFLPLAVGARVVVASRAVASDGASLEELLKSAGATVLQATPASWRMLLAAGWQGDHRLVALCGGEALDRELAQQLAERVRVLFNVYGPTETTIWSTLERVEPGVEDVRIGRPLANTDVFVLDERLEPTPIGVAGELYIGGAGCARGYWKRPELTSERFVKSPFGGGERLYRTGDRARFRADGKLDYLGRLDFQVKLRGFRIELGEIESVLLEDPSVRETVAVVREDAPGDKRLVAYVVGRAGEQVDVDALRAYLKKKLPEYMVPAALVELDALPLSPSKKVDRKALPAPVLGRSSARLAPRTPVEETLSQIWSEILRVDAVGVDDDFFDLGGHSLLATQIASRVEKAFGVRLTLRTLFEATTIAAQAERVHTSLHQGGTVTSMPLSRRAADGPAPLSFAQERLWFLERFQPGLSALNIATGFELTGGLDVSALERSLVALVGRHESLRTTFEDIDGHPVQKIGPPGAVSLAVLERPREEAWELAREEAARPFDLAKGPLVRALVVRCGPEEHVLVVTQHHIASDGWSLGVLARELGELYAAFVEARPARLPELPIQYADYAAWQRASLTPEVLRDQFDYWRAQLADAEPLELPTDRPRPAVMSHRGSWAPFRLPKELTAKLKAVGRRESATLFATLLAGLAALFHRYSGQSKIVVGSPMANRTRVEVEGLVGVFVNTLALAVDVSGDPTFRELLGRARSATIGAHTHQDVPFEKLVSELAPRRDMSRTPLFQTMLVLQNAPGEDLALVGTKATRRPLETGGAQFDITLYTFETPDGLAGAVEYATDLFERSTIERMVMHYATILAGAVEHPESRVSQLPLLSGAERAQLLEWRGWRQEWKEETVAGLVEAQAERTPEAVAVTFGGTSLSYAELERRSNRLGHALRRRGVGRDVLVGVYVERSVEMVVALLGVLKAGGAYVPLDPDAPEERLSFMLSDAAPAVVVTDRGHAAGLGEHGAEVLLVDDASLAGEAVTRPDATLAGRDLAYVIYTSGSTGRPKGVMVEHRGVVNLLLAMRDRLELGPEDRLVAVTTMAFDIAALELFLPLAVGARVVVASRAVASDGASLEELLKSAGATVLQATPASWRMLLAAGWQGDHRLVALCGGEALDRELAQQLAERVRVLFNVYGPTETTIWSTLERVEPGVEDVRIGRPLANTDVFVLDERLEPTPIGVAGELYIGGAGCARGYWKRPELTSERFVKSPFGGGERLYRTGDRARFRADGKLDYLGRLDFQVKLRGFRIELGEIESVLLEDPSVRETVAVVREDAPGDKRLVAYVVGRAGEQVDVDALRAYLKKKLPEYMVPAALVELDALPLSPSKKVDRKALPAPVLGRSSARLAPRTPVEETLSQIWSEILRVDAVGVDDDFFDLGGHSLLATQIASRVEKAFGVRLTLRTLFEATTIAAQAERITAEDAPHSRDHAAILTVPSPVRTNQTHDIPLMTSQAKMWRMVQIEPTTHVLNLPVYMRLEGPLDVASLGRALSEIVRRHEILRFTFSKAGDRPVASVSPPDDVPLRCTDLSHVPMDQREGELARVAQAEWARGFDAARGPLARAALVKVSEQTHALLFTVSHLVFDGASVPVFVTELSELYTAYRSGRSSPLPELPIQFGDVALWGSQCIQAGLLEPRMAYWRRKLEGAPAPVRLPFDRPPSRGLNIRGTSLYVDLPDATANALRALCQDEHASLFNVLLAAFLTLFQRSTGADDLVVLIAEANRELPEMEWLIASAVETIPVRVDLSGDPSFREAVRRVRDAALEAYEHRCSLLSDELLRAGLTGVFVNHLARRQPLNIPELRSSPLTIEDDTALTPLTLFLLEKSAGLTLRFRYGTDVYDAASVARLARDYGELLEMLADPARCSSETRPQARAPSLARVS